MNTLKNYYELCKPNVVLMMLITALVGSLLASKTLPPISLIAFAMLGTYVYGVLKDKLPH